MAVDDRESSIEKINNKNYEIDTRNALKYTRGLLTILGVWPIVISNPTKIQKFVSKFHSPIPSICLMMLLIQLSCHLILRDLGHLRTIIVVGQIIFRTANIMKNLILIARRDAIKFCMRHMETDWRRIECENEREIMTRNLRVGHGLTVLCMSLMYGSGIVYQLIMPLMRGSTINEFNVTVRPMLFPGADLFVDLQSGYNYEIVFCSQCIASFFVYSITIAISDLAAIMVSHACGQIEIVMTRLENLVDDDNAGEKSLSLEERIAWIIRCHDRALRFTTKIDEILRDMCLFEVVSSTLNMCVLEYICMTELKNKSIVVIVTYGLLLGSLCFNIFIFCHIGELLKERCQEVGKATYMIDWYKLPSKTGLSLIMVIAMSHYPRSLTAGRMIELSIYSFGSIMKTTVAYLNMLRAMTE